MAYSHKSHLKDSYFAIATALFGLFASGCAVEVDDVRYEMPDEQDLADDTAYMSQVFQEVVDPRLGFIKLDLSDERQHRFVINRMLRAGNTPDNSPKLFERIERLRARDNLSLKRDGTKGETIAQTSAALESIPCGNFFVPNVTNTAVHSTLDAKVIMTCFNGNDYVYSDLTAVETDEAQSYYLSKAFNWGEQYGAGVYYDDVAVASTIPSGKYHLIESFGFGSDTDTGDTAVYSQIVAFGAPQAPSLTLDHPREWNGGTPIRHCIKRGTFAGNGDCDYAGVDNTGVPTSASQITGIAKMVYLANKWQADPNAWWKNIPNFSSTRIYVPISGTFDAGARPNMDCDIDPVNKFNADDTYARLIRKLEGGWCNAVGGVSQDFIKQIQIDPNDQRLGRFNYAADFGPDCLVNLQDVTLQVKVGAFTTCQELPRASTEVTKEMDFRNSCLAAGTAVLRSDGKYVPVQDINIGDRVVANQRGVSLTVTSISRGGESEPMVRLYDNKGHDVMVTTKHPIVTPMGIVYADQVVEGMQVETEQGASTIIGVERVPYAGEVYNLTLGSDIELANIDELETTMIAGGILVGDNRMQFEMERRDTAERFAVGRSVPDDWRTDYENKRRAR